MAVGRTLVVVFNGSVYKPFVALKGASRRVSLVFLSIMRALSQPKSTSQPLSTNRRTEARASVRCFNLCPLHARRGMEGQIASSWAYDLSWTPSRAHPTNMPSFGLLMVSNLLLYVLGKNVWVAPESNTASEGASGLISPARLA